VVLARAWLDRKARAVTNRVVTVVLLNPKATLAIGVACIVAVVVISWTGNTVGDYREKRHNEWRLQQMTDAVRQADQRIRERMTSQDQPPMADAEPSDEFRGVFETIRDPADPTPESESNP
jgi:hypothetical protein